MDALMAGALPFHATNHFVRLVQILHLQHSIWQFLAPMQQSGASMPRSTLVLRCTKDKVNSTLPMQLSVASSGYCRADSTRMLTLRYIKDKG